MSDQPEDTASLDSLWLQQITHAISHELRSSSRHVKSMTQLLAMTQGDESSDASREYMQSLGSAADVLQARVEAIDWFFGLAAGEFEFAPASLADALESALSDISFEIANARSELHVAGEAAGVPLDVDSDRLRQVFAALIRNSLKFCDTPVRVSVSFEQSHDSVEMVITDSGPGFDAATPGNAFAMFKRFHGAEVPGLGVGLAAVAAVVKRHRGSVAIASSSEAGTTVTLTFPLPPNS